MAMVGTGAVAVLACGGMTVVYVAVLYTPTIIFRCSPPTCYYQYMIRRFICALFSSLICLLISSSLLLSSHLPLSSPRSTWRNSTLTHLLEAYGLRLDHFCPAVFYSLTLTCLIYMGSFLLNSLLFFDSCRVLPPIQHRIYGTIISLASDITAWRNLLVAPITEELVFRACMIPLLLCGGFKPQTTVFLCPIFFSLAHLNHLFEFYSRKNRSALKTSLAVGTQLAYTMVFGSYASFLFIRTGNLIAPLVAHIFCNFMGLPILYSKRGVVVTLAFIAGAISFLWFLMPLTAPALYNIRIDDCRCWQGYCNWR